MERWRLLASDAVLETPWLIVCKNRYQIANGPVIDDYYVVERADFALVVAIEDDALVLVRQYRPATDRFYLALPAGYLHPGESPEQAAARELLEETGRRAANARVIGELHPLPGYIRSAAFVVLSEATRVQAAAIDREEIGEVVRVQWDDAVRMIHRGEIIEMQAVSAILLAKEHLAEPPSNNASVNSKKP